MPLPLLVDAANGPAEPASASFEHLLCHALDASGHEYRHLQVGLPGSARCMDDNFQSQPVGQSASPLHGRLRRLRQLTVIAVFGLTPRRAADADTEWTDIAHPP